MLKNWFKDNGVKVIKWASQNADLNPIENAWSYLKKRVKARQPKNKNELWQFTQQEWQKIPVKYFENLAYSFPSRMKQVIAAKGHALPY